MNVRGFRAPEGLLVVLDGAKGLRAAVREVLGEVPVQRCQWHKRENVVSYLPRSEQPAWRRKLQAAYAPPELRRCETRAPAPTARAGDRERIRGAESRGRAGGHADAPPPECLS